MNKLTVVGLAPLIAALGCGVEEEPDTRVQNRAAAGQFERLNRAIPAQTAFVPRSQGTTREAFIVKLAGAPVSLVQAEAGTKLRAADKAVIRDRLAREQAAVEPGISALGGKVVARYRDAYNGLRVQIQTSQLSALRKLPGVVSVHRLHRFEQNNVNGAQRVAAPGAWSPFAGLDGFRGEGVKVAIIDSGIDYTHADFAGPGTVDAFNAAFATSAAPADPALFGPAAPKVKGGIDLVGDDYDANQPETDIPQPDENPLDCNGHGTHVAGTTAGFGVLESGTTFAGPYDASTYTANRFEIGPGVAPKADLYAVRVFGCTGSTNVVVDALEWAVANDMDVVNMSLGSPFGGADDPSTEASNNAVAAGVIVVASAGNSGTVGYITGSPASASGAISVAAQDPAASFPGASINSAGPAVQTINANNGILSSTALEVEVLLDSAGNVTLGCDPAEYVNVTGKLVVVKRGICARVARAIFGQQAGAAAVLMINNVDGLPPFEGPISVNPDTGEEFQVTIPFLGTSLANEAAVRALDGTSVTFTGNTIPNPAFNTMAGFSSLGPRLGDGHLKPDVTAPGVSIRSAGIGAGSRGAVLSGTSMAAPHTAGLAALARQAHPTWTAVQIKSAIVNTAGAAGVVSYSTRRAGAGVVNATNAVRTSVIAFSAPRETHISLGILERKTDYIQTKVVRIFNRGTTPATFSFRAERPQGSPHAVAVSPASITVPANRTVEVNVAIAIDTATAGDSEEFREVAGLIVATPSTTSNNRVPLVVPYYGVIRPAANVTSTITPRLGLNRPSSTATITNVNSEIVGIADFYAWGHNDAADGQGFVDIRAAGVQAFESAGDQIIVFAVNHHTAWSTPSLVETDVLVDTNLDGAPDFVVVGIDFGLFTAGAFDGQMVAAVIDLNTGGASVQFLAVAPTNSSTTLLPILASQIGLTPENPRFSYSVATFDLNGAAQDSTDGTASFNAFTPAISQGDFVAIEPDTTVTVPVSLDPTEFKLTPALGHLIVTLDNLSGDDEAQLLRVAR